MAFTRRTNDTFGVYEKYRDPETGKQAERCLVQLGPWPTPEDAIEGYRAEIEGHRQTIERCAELLRSSRGSFRMIRHDQVQAEFAIERLEPKLAAVEAYMAAQAALEAT